MLDDFPKVDLSSKNDLDAALDLIRQHAFQVLSTELSDAGLANDREVEKICKDAVDLWIRSAKSRLEPNVTVNGLPFKEGGDGAEPFDHEMSVRVQKLSERADTLTAEAISSRKTIPAQRAAAVKTRSELMERISFVEESRRREMEETFFLALSSESGTEESIKLERGEEIGKTLRMAVAEIDGLAVSLLEQASAAHDQANFVKRLRVMSASHGH